MPRSYVPTLLALKLPEMLLVLALAGVASARSSPPRAPAIEPRRRAILLLLALAALLPIVITVVTRPAMYNGIRHFVFVAAAARGRSAGLPAAGSSTGSRASGALRGRGARRRAARGPGACR